MKAIVTVVGKDRTGIIAKVSTTLCENNINIEDISQTIMQDMFTMIMLVNIEKCTKPFDVISKELDKLGESLSLSIRIQHEDVFNSMHRI